MGSRKSSPLRKHVSASNAESFLGRIADTSQHVMAQLYLALGEQFSFVEFSLGLSGLIPQFRCSLLNFPTKLIIRNGPREAWKKSKRIK
jgi:hypothetical protein